MVDEAEIVICGAGIAGIAVAYFLAVRHELHNVLVVDERPPLSLTSEKSSECYRNWWPGQDSAMIALMNRSIDLLEDLAQQSGNRFRMNRRGYLYLTKKPEQAAEFERVSLQAGEQGAGDVRIYHGRPGEGEYQPAPMEGFWGQPGGADLLLDPSLIQRHFPFISSEVIAALHVRRAGWLSAQQLGLTLLEEAQKRGVRLVKGRLVEVKLSAGQVQGVVIDAGSRMHISTQGLVNAAGPFASALAELLGVTIPVHYVRHLKLTINDPRGALPRQAPLVICADPLALRWSADERQALSEEPEGGLLLSELPAGLHTRPEGGQDNLSIMALWPYHLSVVEPVFPLPLDPLYPEVILRGLAEIIPAMSAYVGKFARPYLDGGYYTQTSENRPLIGPLPVKGAYILAALSGYGIMAACAAGELLAAHITHGTLPPYAAAFAPARYTDPLYLQRLGTWGDSGQL